MPQPVTLIEAIRLFADEDTCIDFMVNLRWPDGKVTCPNCGSDAVTWMAKSKRWQCKAKHAKRQFSIKVGTIFEDSPISLSKWLPAVWLIASAKNGISSHEIHRGLGVTQKTAWFMLHRIRLAMQSGSMGKMSGSVEVDETFIGGKSRFMHKAVRARKIKGTGGMGKTAVLGLLERHGPDGHSAVRAQVVETRRRKTLSPVVREHVETGAVVYTDALKSYNDLRSDYVHQVVDHAEEYVRGTIHTNGIENFWSLLKRSIKGTYVSVEPFHLHRYLDEQVFRFNTRKTGDGDRMGQVVKCLTGRRLTYNDLIGAGEAS